MVLIIESERCLVGVSAELFCVGFSVVVANGVCGEGTTFDGTFPAGVTESTAGIGEFTVGSDTFPGCIGEFTAGLISMPLLPNAFPVGRFVS